MSIQNPEKTTHDLIYPFTVWSTVPSLPKPNFSSISEEEDYDEDQIKLNQTSIPIYQIKEFLTFEDFWPIYNNLERPSSLFGRGGYYFLKSGLKSGNLEFISDCYYTIFNVSCKNDNLSRDVEIRFLHVLLTIFGHNFQNSDKILGVVFESNKNDSKLSVYVNKLEQLERDLLKKQIYSFFGKGLNIQHKEVNSIF